MVTEFTGYSLPRKRHSREVAGSKSGHCQWLRSEGRVGATTRLGGGDETAVLHGNHSSGPRSASRVACTVVGLCAFESHPLPICGCSQAQAA
jgi:hypothetical protein